MSTTPRQSVQRRFVLYGLGGSGKTQICLKYAQSYRERYWAIFWVDASTSASIQQSFNGIALSLQTDQSVESVKRALTNMSQTWLLIFDNADDPSLRLTPYIPVGDRGDVIITTRNPSCRQYSTVGFEEVGEMSVTDSVDLLLKIVYGNLVVNEEVQQQGRLVVQMLGHLALAVTQAGAYIRESSCSFQDYLELYQRRRTEIWAYDPNHIGTNYHHTVYTTWQVSLDAIASMQDARSRYALKLLRLICCYHHEQIELAMFIEAWRQWPEYEDASDWVPWPQEAIEPFELRQVLQKSISLLVSYSLVTKSADASLSLHPLVHEWCREQVSREKQQTDCWRAMSLLAASMEPKVTSQGYVYPRSLVFHIITCLNLFKLCGGKMGEVDNCMEADIWSTLAFVLKANGFYEHAVNILEQVVLSCKSKFGEADVATLRIVYDLSSSYCNIGRPDKAIKLSEQTVQMQKINIGEDHPDTIRWMRRLSNSYGCAGRHKEALTLAEQVLELSKSRFGESHVETFESMRELAECYIEAKRHTEALALTEQVVQLFKSRPEEDWALTVASMYNLAACYMNVRRQKEAEAQITRIAKSKLGETHPSTLEAMRALAVHCSIGGRQEEALRLMDQVIRLYQDRLGENHPMTLKSMNDLSMLYHRIGRQEEAKKLAEQVLWLRREILGETHPDTLWSVDWTTWINSEAGARHVYTIHAVNERAKDVHTAQEENANERVKEDPEPEPKRSNSKSPELCQGVY